jgi:hypothetical protein
MAEVNVQDPANQILDGHEENPVAHDDIPPADGVPVQVINPPPAQHNQQPGHQPAANQPVGIIDLQQLVNILQVPAMAAPQAPAAVAQVPANHQEIVKIPLYDGSTDVEDFINLFQQLAEMGGWNDRLKLLKLKTTLTGKAADCGRPGTCEGIYESLRARFGITPAEAKRQLLAMKSGRIEKFRELADTIRTLTDLAYPGMDNNITQILALDQFKRCVSHDISVFMVSRPPADLDEAVRICGEYATATGGRKKPVISALMAEDSIPEVNAVEGRQPETTVTQKDLDKMATQLKADLMASMEKMVTVCAEAVKQKAGVEMAATSKSTSAWQSTGKLKSDTNNSRIQRKPPSPCSLCQRWHWFKDCPLYRKKNTPADQKGPRRFPKQQGNSNGPQQ